MWKCKKQIVTLLLQFFLHLQFIKLFRAFFFQFTIIFIIRVDFQTDEEWLNRWWLNEKMEESTEKVPKEAFYASMCVSWFEAPYKKPQKPKNIEWMLYTQCYIFLIYYVNDYMIFWYIMLYFIYVEWMLYFSIFKNKTCFCGNVVFVLF